MDKEFLKNYWKSEEDLSHIHGWDFSHIHGRYTEETDLPWNYEEIVRNYLKKEYFLLDIDTGGGEFLLSLNHEPNRTSATEGYPPNIELCKQILLPIGIDFREAGNYTALPFEDAQFDIIINRHGDYDIQELHRILKPGGIFVTEQVGEDNDRELVKLLLPNAEKPFSGLNLTEQKSKFLKAGFSILKEGEAFRPIRFFDVGALVWFAKIIEWEFPHFSVESCFDRLINAQKILTEQGSIQGTIHRYVIVSRK